MRPVDWDGRLLLEEAGLDWKVFIGFTVGLGGAAGFRHVTAPKGSVEAAMG